MTNLLSKSFRIAFLMMCLARLQRTASTHILNRNILKTGTSNRIPYKSINQQKGGMFMKKLLLLSWLIVFALASCSDDPAKTEPGVDPNPTPEPENPEVIVDETMKMQDMAITGFVKDTQGNAVPDVLVSTGESSVLTHSSGAFRLEKVGVVAGRSVVRFEKEGYFDLVRSFVKEEGDIWEVVICPKGNSSMAATVTFNASDSKQLKAGNMKVDMSANSIVVENTGEPYTGTVKADILYLDPQSESFTAMMPGGDLAAVRQDNSEVTLVSYGMVSVKLTSDNGQQLQLKKGEKSVVTFPIPEGMDQGLPETIPLWYFNEKAGLWVESGVAKRIGNEYAGEVSHFSYYNLDIPEERAQIKGRVLDCKDRPVKNLQVKVGQTHDYTNDEGYYSAYVPANTLLKASIPAEEYKSMKVISIPGIAGGSSYTQNISLPCLNIITGRVVNTCSENSASIIWLSYNGQEGTYYYAGVDGYFELRAPEDYTGPAKVNVQGSDGKIYNKDIELNHEDIDVGDIYICDGTPPGGTIICWSPTESDPIPTRQIAFVPAEIGDIIIVDGNRFIFSTDNIFFAIENYSPDKKDYSNIDVSIYSEDEYWSVNGEMTVSVTKLDAVRFQISISGRGYYSDRNSEGKLVNVKASELNAYTWISAILKRDVTSLADLGFPDFTPDVPFPIDLVSTIIESKVMGKGGILDYKRNDVALFNNLKAQADKLGFKRLWFEDGDKEKDVCYQSGEKVINISYDADGYESILEGYDSSEDEVTYYHLQIMVLDGCKVNILEMRSAASSQILKKLLDSCKRKKITE